MKPKWVMCLYNGPKSCSVNLCKLKSWAIRNHRIMRYTYKNKKLSIIFLINSKTIAKKLWNAQTHIVCHTTLSDRSPSETGLPGIAVLVTESDHHFSTQLAVRFRINFRRDGWGCIFFVRLSQWTCSKSPSLRLSINQSIKILYFPPLKIT